MLHRVTLAFSAAALIPLALAAACGSDATEPNEIANVRVVNASVSTAGLGATTEGRVVATSIPFQAATQPGTCPTVERGSDEKIDFTTAGTSNSLGFVQYNFVAKQNYTVVFYAPSNAVVYPDVFVNPTAGNNAIRFINATGTAGDIYLSQPAATIVAPATIASLPAGQVSGFNSTSAPGGTFVQYNAVNTRVRLFNPGQTTGTPRADFTIGSMPANRVATIVLTPPPTGGVATGFMVMPCGS
jgi:hypothetical protein